MKLKNINKSIYLIMEEDNNDMITLNIYNQPPPKSVDETGMNFNQSYPEMNMKIDKPGKNLVFYDNNRNDQNLYNSAPRGNNNKKRKGIQNTIDDGGDSGYKDKNKGPTGPAPIQNVQNRQIIQPPYKPMVYRPTPVGTPIITPVMTPYNIQYATPVVVQGKIYNGANAVNNAPKTVIIKEKNISRRNQEEDCCTAFLAGCGACLTFCCLIGLCCPGPHGHHGYRGRGRW